MASTSFFWDSATIRITSHIPVFLTQHFFVVCSLCRPCTCPKVIPSSLFPLCCSHSRYLASLSLVQLYKEDKGTVSHQCFTLADRSLPFFDLGSLEWAASFQPRDAGNVVEPDILFLSLLTLLHCGYSNNLRGNPNKDPFKVCLNQRSIYFYFRCKIAHSFGSCSSFIPTIDVESKFIGNEWKRSQQ